MGTQGRGSRLQLNPILRMGTLRPRKALRRLRASMTMCWGLEGKAGGKEAERSGEGRPGGREDGTEVWWLGCVLRRGSESSQEPAGGGQRGCVSVCLQSRSHEVTVFAFVPLGS